MKSVFLKITASYAEGVENIIRQEWSLYLVSLPEFHIVDGGYLSWVFGQKWAQTAWPPDYIRSAVTMMDRREPTFREERDPSYKQNRRDKRKKDAFLAKETSRIHIFRETMEEDPRVLTISYPGLEADDLVVLGAWLMARRAGVKANILGQDKDLLQAGKSLRLYNHRGERVTLGRFQSRLPKALQTSPFKFRHVPLCLAIMGDKSDNIPRLVPPRQLWTARDILFETGYEGARKEFKDKFLHNLHQVILPDPECFGFSPGKVYELVRENLWGPSLLKELRPWIKKEVKSWPIGRN